MKKSISLFFCTVHQSYYSNNLHLGSLVTIVLQGTLHLYIYPLKTWNNNVGSYPESAQSMQ